MARHQTITLSFSRVRPGTLARLRQLGLLEEQTVYPTNRAALAALSATRDATPAAEGTK
jgi:sulfate permease, SulP family